MNKLKRFIPYFILFISICIVNLLFITNNMDEVWNYGFSYAIRLGEVPYRDFNLILPPFYPYFMSIPLFINNSYLSFILFHSLIMTGCFYLLFKMYKDYSYLILLISFLLFSIIYPTYNAFLLVLLVLIIYLEKSEYKNKDYLIGLVVALSILTKHSVGIFFIIPSLLFYKNVNLGKRFIGFIIPNIIFLIYLLVTKTLFAFINLCVLGMFDFSSNSLGITISLIIFIIIFIISIFILVKNKSNINNYYLILAYSIYLPLFDSLHLFYVIFIFLILLGENYKISSINYKLVFFVCISIIGIFVGYNKFKYGFIYPNNINHFEFKFISPNHLGISNDVLAYIKDNDVLFYDDEAYFYKIASDSKIGFLDIVNHGNHGYNGSDKIIEYIEDNKDKLFLVKKDTKERIKFRRTQLDKDGYLYIIKHFKKIDSIQLYDVYKYDE